jgi:septal ring factor EnvC (AmiA/AmiB activator)
MTCSLPVASHTLTCLILTMPVPTLLLLKEENERLRTEVSSLKSSNAQSEKRAADFEATIKDLKAEQHRCAWSAGPL